MMKKDGFVADSQLPIVLTCPECAWKIQGTDVDSLQREKQFHAMFQCPLPVRVSEPARPRQSAAVR